MKMNFDKQWNMETVFEQLMQPKQMILRVDPIQSVKSSFEKVTILFWVNSYW